MGTQEASNFQYCKEVIGLNNSCMYVTSHKITRNVLVAVARCVPFGGRVVTQHSEQEQAGVVVGEGVDLQFAEHELSFFFLKCFFPSCLMI